MPVNIPVPSKGIKVQPKIPIASEVAADNINSSPNSSSVVPEENSVVGEPTASSDSQQINELRKQLNEMVKEKAPQKP